MPTAINFGPARAARVGEWAKLRQPWLVGLFFSVLIAAQALGLLLLGTGRAGRGLAESILVLLSFLALACVWHAFRRAHGITPLFWFLFPPPPLLFLLPPTFHSFPPLSPHS